MYTRRRRGRRRGGDLITAIIYRRRGTESAKQCAKCNTVWKDSMLEDDVDKNECPFCGEQFDPRNSEVVRLPRIRRKRLHWRLVSELKLVTRLSSDINEIDWAIFKNVKYFELLQKRATLIETLGRHKLKLIGRDVTQNGK